jgi:hypothetical protein
MPEPKYWKGACGFDLLELVKLNGCQSSIEDSVIGKIDNVIFGWSCFKKGCPRIYFVEDVPEMLK